MKKKPRATAKRTKRATPKVRPAHHVSDAMRAEDERLRDELRNADLDKFDAVVGRAFPSRPASR